MKTFKLVPFILVIFLQACANPSIVNVRDNLASDISKDAVIYITRFEGNPSFVEESTDYFTSLLEGKINNRIVQGSVLRQESTDIIAGGNLAPLEIALKNARDKGYDILVMGKVTSHKTMGSLNGFSTIRVFDVKTGERIANFHRPSGLLMAFSEHQCVMAAVDRTADDTADMLSR